MPMMLLVPEAWRLFLGAFGTVLTIDALFHLAGAQTWLADNGVLPPGKWKQLSRDRLSIYTLRSVRRW